MVEKNKNVLTMGEDGKEKITDGVDLRKRELFKIFGKTSVAVGTLALIESCTRKPQPEKLLPYLEFPETTIPGIPYWFATTCSGCPASCGILVKVEDLIPRKIEGNPDNPLSRGKTCARGQAIIHQLFSPDRIKKPRLKKADGNFEEIDIQSAVKLLAERLKSANPEKVFIFTGNITGKTEKFYLDFASKMGIPEENIIRWESFSFAPLRKATKIVFGKESVPVFRIDKADLLISFGADFLDTGPSTVLYSRWFARFHSVNEENNSKGKFIYISPRRNLTGLNADRWIKVKPGGEIRFAISLLNKLIERGAVKHKDIAEKFRTYFPGKVEELTGVPEKYIDLLVEEIKNSKNPLIFPPYFGDENSTSLATICLIINYLLGAVDKIVLEGFEYTKLSTPKDIKEFVRKVREQKVDVLLIHAYDPVFTIPKFIGFEESLKLIPFVVSFSYHEDETSQFAHLVIPDYHQLEKWGDAEIIKGLVSFCQPVISPLYPDTKQTEDVLIEVANLVKEGAFQVSSFKDYIRAEYGFSDEDWVKALEKGGIFSVDPENISGSGEISLQPAEQIKDAIRVMNSQSAHSDGSAIIVYPSYHLYDGRMANSPWIQEFFDVSTRLAWRNALEVNPKTAEKLGLKNADIVEITYDGKKIELPVITYYGIAEGVYAISLGRGHKNYGRFATGRGVNPLEIIPESFDESGEISFIYYGFEIRKTGKRLKRLPTNEGVPRQLGRDIAQFTTLSILPKLDAKKKFRELEEIMKKKFPRGDWEKYGRDSAKPNKYRWKMVIDLDKCIGCSACTIACQIENNLPFVGEEEVIRGREMTWVRVERYFFSSDEVLRNLSGENHKGHSEPSKNGETDPDKVVFVPMMCQQCEYAPCEYVCPVYATMHTSDGLNAQVYNRCVGTRFCANNCPYKVRYFNWHDYFKNVPEPLNMAFNPSVTVRSKGVMEKCTFCIQRIKYAEHDAKIEGRDIRDGEVVPACAQVCPADAITFGNIKDENSAVSKARKSKRINWVLKELGTEPSITYLEKVFIDELDKKFEEKEV